MRRVIRTYGFDEIALKLANTEPAFQHYAEFERVLEAINRFFEDFGSCPGCIYGSGDLGCAIRECCKEKSCTVCSGCLELDRCEKLVTTPLFRHRFKALEAALNL